MPSTPPGADRSAQSSQACQAPTARQTLTASHTASHTPSAAAFLRHYSPFCTLRAASASLRLCGPVEHPLLTDPFTPFVLHKQYCDWQSALVCWLLLVACSGSVGGPPKSATNLLRSILVPNGSSCDRSCISATHSAVAQTQRFHNEQHSRDVGKVSSPGKIYQFG